MKFQRNVPNLAKLSRWDENRDAKGPLKATRVSIEFNSMFFSTTSSASQPALGPCP
jgi:hypothetical protein